MSFRSPNGLPDSVPTGTFAICSCPHPSHLHPYLSTLVTIGLIGGMSILSYLSIRICIDSATCFPHSAQLFTVALMIWSGASLNCRPPPSLPILPVRCPSLPFSSFFTSALKPLAGGRLEFREVFFGFFSACFFNFCISSHSSTIKASFASSVNCFRLGSSFMLLLYHFLSFVTPNLPELSNYYFAY
jgi:hypothetical protein